MAIYDPYSPHVVGSMFTPLITRSTNLDTDTMIGYEFVATEPVLTCPAWVRLLTPTFPPGQPYRQSIITKLYHSNPVAVFPCEKVIIPAGATGLGIPYGLGASLEGGATTIGDALNNPADGKFIRLAGGAGTFVGIQFLTGNQIITNKLQAAGTVEIIDVTVNYVISGDFDSAATPMRLGMYDALNDIEYVMDESVSGPVTVAQAEAMGRSRFGELNPFWYDGIDPNTVQYRMPWVYQSASNYGLISMSQFDGGNICVSAFAPSAGNWDIHYMALEVTYRPIGNLIGVGGVDVSYQTEIITDTVVWSIPILSLPELRDEATTAYLPTLVPGERYTIMVSKAIAGDRSLEWSSPIIITGFDQLNDLLTLQATSVTKPIALRSVPAVIDAPLTPAIVWHALDHATVTSPVTGTGADPFNDTSINYPDDVNSISPDGHAYHTPGFIAIAADGTTYISGMIVNDVTGDYPWLSFYARCSSDTSEPLIVSQVDDSYPPVPVGPTGSIDVATFNALPEIVDGWRLVTIAMDPPIAFDNGATTPVFWFMFTTAALSTASWEIATATCVPIDEGPFTPGAWAFTSYGAEDAYMFIDMPVSATYGSYFNYDVSVWASIAMDTVTGLTAVIDTQTLTTTAGECGEVHRGVPTGIYFVTLEWDAAPTVTGTGFGYYEVQRQDTLMPLGTWETIAKIITQTVVTMNDYEAKVGVVSTYRVRMVHATGIVGAWSNTPSVTITIPGVTGTCVDTGVLIMTSNVDPTLNLAMVITGDRETFNFVESDWRELVPLHDKDYQIAQWPTERGGVQFTRTCMTNTVGVPSPSLDAAFTPQRDLAWTALPYVCVRDETGRRWLANINIPSGTITRVDASKHIHLVEVTITEVTATPYPIDGVIAP